jgi:hypothetical protein
MAYFSSKQDRVERGSKIAADIACAVLLLTFAVVFFGWIGGALAFLVLEAALIGVDYLVPNGDDVAGVVR